MHHHKIKILFILLLLALSHIGTLASGYYHGYIAGRRIETNARFRFERSQLGSIMSSDEAYKELVIDDLGNGNAVLTGRLTAENYLKLEQEVSKLYGSSFAKRTLKPLAIAQDMLSDNQTDPNSSGR